jgi:hypothetical protein
MKRKGKEGPCENPYKEWIFVSEGHGHPLVYDKSLMFN